MALTALSEAGLPTTTVSPTTSLNQEMLDYIRWLPVNMLVTNVNKRISSLGQIQPPQPSIQSPLTTAGETAHESQV